MLESNAKAILGVQNKGIGFDSDVADTAGTTSTGNRAFSTELTRAQDSIAGDASSNSIKNDRSADVKQSGNTSTVDSPHTNKIEDKQLTTAGSVESKNNGTAVKTDKNSAYKNQVLNGSEQVSLGSKVLQNSGLTPASVGDVAAAAAVTVDPGGDARLLSNTDAAKNIHEKQATNVVLQEGPSTTSASDATLLTQTDTLLNASTGDQDLAGSEYGFKSPAVDEKLYDSPLANQRQSFATPIQPGRIDNPADGVVSLNGSIKTTVADTLQELNSVNRSTNTMADADESATAGLSRPSITDELASNVNSAALTANPNAVSNDSQPNYAASSLEGVATYNSAETGHPVESLSYNVGSSVGVALSNVEGRLTTPVTSAQSAPLNSSLGSNSRVNSGANPNTVPQNTVSGHEFLRSIASTRPDALAANAGTVASSAAEPIVNETVQPGSIHPQGKLASQTSLLGNTPQNTTVDTTVLVNKPAAGAVVPDGAETQNLNTQFVNRGFIVDNSSGTDSDSAGAQHTFAHTAAKLEANADKGITNTSVPVVAATQIKTTDVTPATQIKQLLGAKQQPEMVGLQAVNGLIETPSSNVYHVTTNGIITANSTSLNAAPLSDLASAPRTVLLDQPNADQSLVENLRWAVNEKLSRVTVNVSPANLGPISVSVDVENQNMNVSIITNNVVAKEAIDSILPRMREHFSSEGYQQVSVDVSSQQERNSNLRNQTAEFFDNQNDAGSDSHTADPQNADISQHDITPEQSQFVSERRSSSHSLIDTYA